MIEDKTPPPFDLDFRLAALWVEVAIVEAQRGVPGAAARAADWLEMLKDGDYSFVPEEEADRE